MANRVLRDHSEPCEHGELASCHAWTDYLCPGGREVTIPLGRVIVSAGATLKAQGVLFFNVQLVLQDGSNGKVEGCSFDMTELTVLGIDFTIDAELEV